MHERWRTPSPGNPGYSRLARAILGLLVAVAPALADGGEAEVPWTRNLKAALAESAASSRPVMVDVWAIWCVPCKEMDDTTYRDPAVVRAAAAFVPVKVDHDVQELFVERHRVDALPLVLFLDAEGREISRRAGRLSAAELLATMTVVRDGYGAYLEALGRAADPAAGEVLGAYLLAAGNPARAADTLRRALKQLPREDAASREPLELQLAEAQLADDEFKPAAESFARLAESAVDPELRGLALAGLVRAERGKGRADVADQALERLRREFPGRAAEFDAAP